MKFLLDAQLPPALAAWLRGEGHEATPARDVGLREAEDLGIWKYAYASEMVLVTKDEDFAQYVRTKKEGPPVVWLRIGNSSNRSLREWLEPHWPGIVQLLEDGSQLVEVI